MKITVCNSKTGNDGLASSVLRMSEDLVHVNHSTKKLYIPYCMYENHKGIVLDENTCVNRQCKYFRRFYEL